MNLMKYASLKATVLMAIIYLFVVSPSLHAASAAPYAGFENWLESEGHNRYGSMNLIDLGRFEGGLERLEAEHRIFYKALTTALCENEEFMASTYLNEPTPPFKKEILFSMIIHGVEARVSAFGVYTFMQQSNLAASCGGCFSAHNIDNLTPDCSTCYKGVMSSTSNNVGLIGFGLNLAKSGTYLVKDIVDACSSRGKVRFEPTEAQKEREAQKISLYLTLKKHTQITNSDDRDSLRRDYKNWVLTILRAYYPKGEKQALVNIILENIARLPSNV